MWKQIAKLSSFREFRVITARTYLTQNYKLNQEWDERLKTPILEKINADNLFVDLSTKFQQKRKITAIDVDIYCNKVSDKNIEEAMDLAFKLRKTEQASRMLDSTQHALVRLVADHPENLLTLLSHRLEYGVFPDSHAINMLLDKYIEEKNFMVAARLATFQMLQEDFEHPITLYMSLYASYKFLNDLQTFTDLIPPPPPEVDPQQQQQQSGKKKKVEEIKVRVKYLRNPYFDDHFDIKNTNHLVGKTFLYLADEVQSVDEVLAHSLRLVGFALYEKFEKGNEFLSANKAFYKEVVDKVKSLAEKIEGLDSNEEGKKFFDNLNNIATQKEGKVEEIIEGFMKKAISENESKDIEDQKKVNDSLIFL